MEQFVGKGFGASATIRNPVSIRPQAAGLLGVRNRQTELGQIAEEGGLAISRSDVPRRIIHKRVA